MKVRTLPRRGRDPHWLTLPQAGWRSLLQPEVSAIFTMSSAAELLDGGAALPGVSGGCLGALLIRLLVQFGVDQNDADTLADQLADATANPRRRLK